MMSIAIRFLRARTPEQRAAVDLDTHYTKVRCNKICRFLLSSMFLGTVIPLSFSQVVQCAGISWWICWIHHTKKIFISSKAHHHTDWTWSKIFYLFIYEESKLKFVFVFNKNEEKRKRKISFLSFDQEVIHARFACSCQCSLTWHLIKRIGAL